MLLDESTGDKFIDLNNIPLGFEIPLQNIIDTRPSYENKDLFTFEEISVNDSSASIRFKQFGCKMLIEVFGPREVKYREKMKMDSAIIETYIKMNHEANRESI
jgi:hypothetical protein